ncbi:MAG: XdhC family protein [Solirubrobacteraceae bacterium]|nr:XdhC family protein [Solirubrobacteraceae bacterium]
MLADVLTTLSAWSAAGEPAAIATVVQVHGSAPLPTGTVMAVRADGACMGGVSGGCVEQQVIEAARDVAGGGAARRLRFAPTDDPLTSTALPCGGGIDVLVEAWGPSAAQQAFAAAVLAGSSAVLRSEAACDLGLVLHVAAPKPRLVLVGAGLVADALAGLSTGLGWDVSVIDPRSVFADRTTEQVLARWPAEALAAAPPLGPDDALIALSHHPALDDEALAAGLASGAGFVGALGSRRSHAERLERLRERGVPNADLQRLVAPVGLDLGGWSPREVALSIASELIAVRHGRGGGRLVDATGAIHAGSGRVPAAAREVDG